MFEQLHSQNTTKFFGIVLLLLLALAAVSSVWLSSSSNTPRSSDSQTTTSEAASLPPFATDTVATPPTATLLIAPVVDQSNSLQLSLLSKETLQLMGITVELLFDQTTESPPQQLDPYQIDPTRSSAGNQEDTWSTPVNRLDCDGQLCRAQLALISLSPNGIEPSNQPFAVFTIPPEMTEALKNVTIDTENTVAITKTGETVLLDVSNSLVGEPK